MPTSLIGWPVTCAHAERGTAAGIAVHAGQHDAGEPIALVEAAGDVDGVLAGQRVGDQQGLVRPREVAHLRQLVPSAPRRC